MQIKKQHLPITLKTGILPHNLKSLFFAVAGAPDEAHAGGNVGVRGKCLAGRHIYLSVDLSIYLSIYQSI